MLGITSKCWLVWDLFVYYILGCEPFVCSWGLHVTQIHTHFTHSSLGGHFLCLVDFPKVSRVQASGYQHANTHHLNPSSIKQTMPKVSQLTKLWTHLSNQLAPLASNAKVSISFAILGQRKQFLTRLSVFPLSKCPALSCNHFENSFKNSIS